MINAAAPMMGGMICPPVEVAASTAPANSLENPSRFIIGMVNTPSVTVLATEDPEMVPNKAEDNTETFAGPPAVHPAMAMAMSIKNFPRPVFMVKMPNRTKWKTKVATTPKGTP